MQVILQKIFEYTFRLRSVPLLNLYYLLALVDNRLSHADQLLSVKHILAVVYFRRLVGYASHLKHLNCMSWL